MKWLLGLMLVGAVAFAALCVPPRTAARITAHGLRSTWDWLSSLGTDSSRQSSVARPQRTTRKAQAAPPAQRRAGREGILLQPPREKLAPSDRAALDELVERSR